MYTPQVRTGLCLAFSFWAVFAAGNTAAQKPPGMDPGKARVIEYWTSERRASAIPRDLVIDPRGLAYLRRPDGALSPHGHDVAAQATQRKQASPPSGAAAPASGDGTPPSISNMNPGVNQTIGASYTFSATVTDPSGVKSVTFKVQKAGSIVQSFSASRTSDPDVWSVGLQEFTDGDWSWWVEAKDSAPKGGNSGSSATVNFKVSSGTSGGGTDDTVTNAHWTAGGTVTSASGRLYFEMPGNAKKKIWWGYVCSGTVATDDTTGRSVIVTAAHCVYDDVNKAFARNVMFIPDQDGTTGSATDRNCSNDPVGCWVASFGVVDVNWTTRTFPDNIAWDYGFYVVADSGAHQGNGSSLVLDSATGNLWIDFNLPSADDGQPGAASPDFTYALGYSYSDDPKLMYCAEDMTTETTEGAVNWWLPHCGLSGGSSGGPWIQPMNGNSGPIISVNSWGYTSSPGMAGPKLVGTSAQCVFGAAKTSAFQNPLLPDGEAGIAVTCP